MNRRLRHTYPEDCWLFATWHLHGTLPHAKFAPPSKLSSGEAFLLMDRYADRTDAGPRFLSQQPIAELVVDSLFKGVELGHYRLGAFAVMGSHVHVLIFPLAPPSLLLKALKGVTARESNRILGRTGEPFWQRESYDHWVRDGRGQGRIAAYIENNPVTAGLVRSAEEYLWCSAHERWRGRFDTI